MSELCPTGKQLRYAWLLSSVTIDATKLTVPVEQAVKEAQAAQSPEYWRNRYEWIKHKDNCQQCQDHINGVDRPAWRVEFGEKLRAKAEKVRI